MILQTLNQLYDRVPDIAPFGYSKQKISYELILSLDGTWHIGDLRIEKEKIFRPRLMQVPGGSKPSGSGIHTNFMWDNTGYFFGRDNKGDSKRAEKSFQAFREEHRRYSKLITVPALNALLKFLDSWNPANCELIDEWENMAGTNFVIRLDGDHQYLHDHPDVNRLWEQIDTNDGESVIGQCLVTGEITTIARIHSSKIKGVKGTKGEYVLVGFDDEAYRSYGKTQSYNGPVGVLSAFKYATALNLLLEDSSKQKIQIGDATTVFWTEKETPLESFMGVIFDPRNDAASNQEVQLYLKAVKNGRKPDNISPDIQFYLLGLTPNASRLSVRFWHVSTVGDINKNLGRHFHDLEIAKQFETDPEYPGIWQLLKQTARETKDISPLLAGSLMRSILEGTVYPRGLLTALIRRIHAEQSLKDRNGRPVQNVNYLRAAMIKAILNRNYRFLKQGLEVSMSLNKDDTRPAYLCGRLFAVLEKAQTDAIGRNINSTIKDRYFGAASATPRIVFPQLLRLTQHHIGKSDYGFIVDKQIEEILGNLQEFPAHLSLDDQGLFSIGYYHQRQTFFPKKESN
jgi:CRISPR-associated protein Csd1